MDELLARLTPERAARLSGLLRRIALDQFRDDQGGCSGLSEDGKWIVAGASFTLTPDDLDLAFELSGIAKQPIVSKGDCRTCLYAERGRERGWRAPCVTCKRPIMSNYEPRDKRVASAA